MVYKRFLYIILFLLSILSVQGQNRLRPITQEEPSPSHKISEIPSPETDKKIEDSLEDLIQKAGWFPEIQVEVSEGIVLIRGKASDQEQVKWLANAADRLPSVIAVINQAEVMTPSFTDFSPVTKELGQFLKIAKKALPSLLLSSALLLLFIWLGKYIQLALKRLWRHGIPNPFLLATVTRISMIPIWVVFFYLVLLTIGLPRLATSILGGTGILGIVFGFAFKGIAENYLSGILLAIRSPFTKGDLIEVDDVTGFVQSLNMRGTTIVDYDGNQTLIPNTKVVQSVVKNYSANPLTRSFFTVGIGYEDSIKKSQEIIKDVLAEARGIATDPPPKILVESLGSATVNLKVFFWFNVKQLPELVARSRAISIVKEALMANGVSLPDEAREIVFADPLKVSVLKGEKSKESSDETRKHKRMMDPCLTTEDEEEDMAEQLLNLADRNSLPTSSSKDNLL
jgi:small conductance mechanosensitive channel